MRKQKPDGLSVADVKTTFVDVWRSILKANLERFENVKLQGNVHEDYKGEVEKLLTLNRTALSQLQSVEDSLGTFGETVSILLDFTVE